ncbi:hypothetical protein AAFF_G00231640 [Aldrovandia affinis]|uniref:Optineurin n=1 Tax=Aldrovandia affinis TaxID=143900 RepID=A0AAD7W4J3_9TELE|nr:hypothetical protein AAFF_G00231640 [Aldrovandia affinis]
MASNAPVANGDISLGAQYRPGGVGQPCMISLEETIQQMNVLIKENRELKEALKRTNSSMKERFEGLAAWKERQKEERDFLEGKLEEAKKHMSTLTKRNEELRKRLQGLEGSAEGAGQTEVSLEMEVLQAVIKRLQAEKSDLVAMNTELQLQAGRSSPGRCSPGDSFIQIRTAQEEEMYVSNPFPCSPSAPLLPTSDLIKSQRESQELTVSQLLQALREETERGDKLELKLQAASERISALEPQALSQVEQDTQTAMQMGEGACPKRETPTQQEAPGKEVEMLGRELQQVRANLDRAEQTKKTLSERCIGMEQNLATLQNQLVDKQQVQAENYRLKLELESVHSIIKMEQKKTEEEKKSLAKLQDAYTRLHEEYFRVSAEAKKPEHAMSKEEASELQSRLDIAEQALAAKQQKIDEMKQEIFSKEQELDTISVFQAQAEVYSSDFYAEREAREKIHEEKERLAAQLEFMKKHNSQLQEEMESLGRQSLTAIQRRHLSPRGASPQGGALAPGQHGARGEVQIPEYACPKCNEVLPDLDTLQIHIMDCID